MGSTIGGQDSWSFVGTRRGPHLGADRHPRAGAEPEPEPATESAPTVAETIRTPITPYVAPRSGSTATGIPTYVGPRGGVYHYSKNGNKVYQKRK